MNLICSAVCGISTVSTVIDRVIIIFSFVDVDVVVVSSRDDDERQEETCWRRRSNKEEG